MPDQSIVDLQKRLKDLKKAKRFLDKYKKPFTFEAYLKALKLAGIEATPQLVDSFKVLLGQSARESMKQTLISSMSDGIHQAEKTLSLLSQLNIG